MADTVLEIMSDVGETVAEPSSTVREVWTIMREHVIQHVPVLDGDTLVGLITSWDVAKVAMEHRSDALGTMLASELMEDALDRVHPKDPIDKALKLLRDGRFHSVPVVDDEERLVGILTTTDLLRHLAED